MPLARRAKNIPFTENQKRALQPSLLSTGSVISEKNNF
jgi:hypothetical protein